ncbi:MAG: hypothetical protein AAF497_10030, partial [Planctomycetota bacterium]
AQGDYVVTWSSLNQDGSGWGVYAQRYATPSASPTLSNSLHPETSLSDPSGNASIFSVGTDQDDIDQVTAKNDAILSYAATTMRPFADYSYLDERYESSNRNPDNGRELDHLHSVPRSQNPTEEVKLELNLGSVHLVTVHPLRLLYR